MAPRTDSLFPVCAAAAAGAVVLVGACVGAATPGREKLGVLDLGAFVPIGEVGLT